MINREAFTELVSNPSPVLLDELILCPEDTHQVAARHSVPPELIDLALVNPVFKKKLVEAKAQLEKEGEPQRAMARYLYQEALESAHIKALDPRTSPKDAISWVETLAGISGVKKGPQAAEGGGTNFSLTIDLGDQTVSVKTSAKQPATIEGEVVDADVEDLPVVSIDYEFDE